MDLLENFTCKIKRLPIYLEWNINYKKRKLIILLPIVLFLAGCSTDQPSNLNKVPVNPPAIYQTQNQQYKNDGVPINNNSAPEESAPSGYYINTDGNKVPSPYAATTIPIGATARCRDGTYSFSQHRSGTCSHHGGVDEWL